MAKYPRESYTVGWLCALPMSELVAARKMLDDRHDAPDGLPHDDENSYTYGSIKDHNVVIACLPPGMPGNLSALKLTQPLSRSFPNMKIHLFVGIGGGIPRNPPSTDPEKDIHLGDVVVGWAERTGVPAVIHYDLRREVQDGEGQLLGQLDRPDRRLLNALGTLLANHEGLETDFAGHLRRTNELPKLRHPGIENDKLYASSYVHEGGDTCSGCNSEHLVELPARSGPNFVFHQGTILSGNSVMMDAMKRDQLSKRFYDAICFEMEAAGVMDEKHCLVIRGISDYCDSHKNHSWQGYAAAAASAFAREFLLTIESRMVQEITNIQWKILFKVPAKNKSTFTGREGVLDQIEAAFQSNHHVALTGIAGIGKTYMALQYCDRYRIKYPQHSVIWIHSGTATRFHQTYHEVAMTLGAPRSNDGGINEIMTDVSYVRGWLALEGHPGWLIVIDNAGVDETSCSPQDSAKMSCSWSKYIPSRYNGRILVTTHNKGLATKFTNTDQVIYMHTMSIVDGSTLLRTELRKPATEEETVKLVELLRGIPLAITQAAAYINNDELTSPSDYISMFGKTDKNKADLLAEETGGVEEEGDTPVALISAWKRSFEQIKKEGLGAAENLCLMHRSE